MSQKDITLKPATIAGFITFCDSVGTRTLDPLIKSQLLYQLSYRINMPVSGNKYKCSTAY